MAIYMISNRKVENNQFVNFGFEHARRDFRVAKCEIEPGSDKASYRILNDKDFKGYAEVVEALNLGDEGALENLTGTAYMFADLYNQMLKAPNSQSDCLFFIHGFANTLNDNLVHIKRIHDIYIAPGDSGIKHLVFVAWPSIGIKAGTYHNDQEDAEETGRVLGALFSKLFSFFLELFEKSGKERCSNMIHLAAHSMGNTVLDYMLQNIPEHKLFQVFGEVLLLNSDVRYDIFEDGRSFSKLEKLAARTHIYISQSDEVLSVLSQYTKNFNQRLGYKGPRKPELLPGEMYIIDTTNVGRGDTLKEKTLDHWGYLERKRVIKDIKQVLLGIDNDEIKGRKETSKGSNYLKLKRIKLF